MFVEFKKVWVGNESNPSNDYPRPQSTEEIQSRIRRLSDERYENLCFIGGDPVQRHDIFKLLEFAYEHDFQRMKIVTHARAFKDREQIKEFFQRGALFFEVPIFGDSARLHDSKTCVRHSFRDSIEGLKLIRSTEIHPSIVYRAFLQINLMIDESNCTVISRMTEFLLRLEMDRLRFVLTSPRIRLTEIIPSVKRSMELCMENRCWPLISGIPPCLMHNYEYFLQEFFLPEPNTNDACDNIPACDGCIYSGLCKGVNCEYLRHFGEEEFRTVIHTDIDLHALKKLRQ